MRSLEEIIHINAQPDPDSYMMARIRRNFTISGAVHEGGCRFELEAPANFKMADTERITRGEDNAKAK